MEADFKQFYQIDLVKEGFSNNLTWRRFLILIKGLPNEGSAYVTWLKDKKNRSFVESSQDTVSDNMA